MKKLQQIRIDLILIWSVGVVFTQILAMPLTVALQSLTLFSLIWLSRYIPYKHPYGYKGDWYGYKEGTIK
ncbi:hypothetical protein A3A09_03730 [Candidatus Nomurabacteria bacterium RIFCSPLOWO2_01_FULL_42_20]|uniref:Uncharacterized protein n=1 Tax=Candidatus Nomurabacteria bacterium RIFCSPHIGHO2_01_FULL_42_16 TaxID=1801743 RepID=A0A1F6VI39_9BACT|nr:MAG: hypothetical protein A2824_00895 [Candidatus Nomurabacteria bacterium RIFCSPHIGHO2_01_FULL_42_16]OGI91417.1 MAG: hypothetical protein A3A09_03730 [Candidatus Nomurabacteria bacterium RIFCSPLOWO2_01_FULL_42_20]